MTTQPLAAPEDRFKPGLEGIVACETEIAEPDKEGSALRYRGVDIEDLVDQALTSSELTNQITKG